MKLFIFSFFTLLSVSSFAGRGHFDLPVIETSIESRIDNVDLSDVIIHISIECSKLKPFTLPAGSTKSCGSSQLELSLNNEGKLVSDSVISLSSSALMSTPEYRARVELRSEKNNLNVIMGIFHDSENLRNFLSRNLVLKIQEDGYFKGSLKVISE